MDISNWNDRFNEENIAIAKEKIRTNIRLLFLRSNTLKTIERANPSIVVMEKGTITQNCTLQR
jgi:hypothetical protein